jgi:glycerophosphoryl diester phosphodiesterase
VIDRQRAPTRRLGVARGRGVILLALAITAAWYGLAWVRHVPANQPRLVIAHRGAAGGGAPEGTLAAFRAAIDTGADWLEFDVRSTSDDVLVVLHDATVDRTTDGQGRVADLTFEQVRALDAGDGATIPTVEEVVGLAASANVPILPEIKDGPRDPLVAGRLIDLLRRDDYLDRAVIQAFEAETLASMRELAPEARGCWLTGLGEFEIAAPPIEVDYVCPMGEMLLLNPDTIRQAHAAGLGVLAWWSVAESALTDRILEGYGVDGLIVDDVPQAVNR